METIEERAKEAGIVSQYKSDYRYDPRSVESGYMQGATEQKAIDDAEYVNKVLMGNGSSINYYKQGYHDAIEKACEWLKENIEGGVHPQSAYGFADRFRKAMEE